MVFENQVKDMTVAQVESELKKMETWTGKEWEIKRKVLNDRRNTLMSTENQEKR